MGLWAKMKGVFSRIGSGIKKGFDWLSQNRDKIKTITDTAQQMIPGASQYITKGEGILNKGLDAYNRFRT